MYPLKRTEEIEKMLKDKNSIAVGEQLNSKQRCCGGKLQKQLNSNFFGPNSKQRYGENIVIAVDYCRSNIDILEALISMSTHLFIYKKSPVHMRKYQDLKNFHKHEFSPIKCQQNIQPTGLFRTTLLLRALNRINRYIGMYINLLILELIQLIFTGFGS